MTLASAAFLFPFITFSLGKTSLLELASRVHTTRKGTRIVSQYCQRLLLVPCARRPFTNPRNLKLKLHPIACINKDRTVHGRVQCCWTLDRRWTTERGFMSKVWLITGASRGLGRAFTEAVLEEGDRVVATARNPEQLVELENRYAESIRTVRLDVTNEAQANAAFEAAIESL